VKLPPVIIPTNTPTDTPEATPTVTPSPTSADVLGATRTVTATPTPMTVPKEGVLGASKTGESINQNIAEIAVILLVAFGVVSVAYVFRRKNNNG